jgi:O-antigen/teichoic acid export membrane protein
MSRAISRNFALIAASNLLAPALSLALVLAIGRLQGVEVLGKYSLLTSLLVFGASAAGFGLPVVITREVAQAPEHAGRWFASAATLATALSLPVVALAVVACALATPDRELALALALACVAALPSAVTQCAEAVLLAFEHARDFVAINLSETAARAALGTWLVWQGYGIVAIAALVLALRVASVGFFVAALRRRGVAASLRPDASLARRLLGYVPVTGLIPIVNAFYARADVFLLSSLGSWRDVGLYGAALRLVDLARSIPPAYARAVYPMLARLRAGSAEEYAAAGRHAVRQGLLLGIPLALALYGSAEPVIRLLYGDELAPAASVLRVLAWAVVPVSLAIVLAQVLFAADKQGVDLGVNVTSMVASALAALVLIPRFGALGAAASVLLASTLYATLQYAGVARFVGPLGVGPDLARLAAVAGAGLAAHWAAASAGPFVATAAALAGAAGAGALLGLLPTAGLPFGLAGRPRAAGPEGGRR